jgi:hypothetical protein
MKQNQLAILGFTVAAGILAACSLQPGATGSTQERDITEVVSITACPSGSTSAQCPAGSFAVLCANGTSEVDTPAKIADNEECALCAPTTCSAQGALCGSIADGCGGTLSCGPCGGTVLVDHLSGKCLDVEGGGYGNGTRIDEYDCNGTGAQQWVYNSTEGIITNPASGRCLDTGWGTTDGSPIEIADCNPQLTGNQQWRLQTDGTILNTYSNKCLNIWGGNPANGTPIELYECTATSNELWSHGATLVDHLSGKCLDVQQANYTNGNPIDEYTCNGTGAQQWVYDVPTGTIHNAASGMCLDTGWGTTDGTKIAIAGCDPSLPGNQQWRLQSDGSILNTYSNRCLNIWGGSTADDAPIELYECYGTSNELWTLGE